MPRDPQSTVFEVGLETVFFDAKLARLFLALLNRMHETIGFEGKRALVFFQVVNFCHLEGLCVDHLVQGSNFLSLLLQLGLEFGELEL